MIKLNILVKPNARKESLEKLQDGSYRVFVKAPAKEGKANEALIKFLAKQYSVPQSKVRIVRGAKARYKLVEIN